MVDPMQRNQQADRDIQLAGFVAGIQAPRGGKAEDAQPGHQLVLRQPVRLSEAAQVVSHMETGLQFFHLDPSSAAISHIHGCVPMLY